MSAYINQLSQHAPAPSLTQADTLAERFDQWWVKQPLATRVRAYSIEEITTALGTQGRNLSPILIQRGWVRHRRWQHRQHYFRVWLPPTDHLE
ncbi:MAG TPA: hypothetical protein VMV78_07910 [Thiobacillus sp.]|nr:hypothetical protein [Thiobacillus sp.]